MSSQLYVAFVASVLVLLLIPGPNVALIIANSVAHGARYGLLTVAGTASAQALQLALVAIGMTEFLNAMGSLLGWVRWLGVAYLLYLGWQQWRAPATDLAAIPPQARDTGAMLRRAALVSLSNPKTLFFYSAFLPQFIVAGRPVLGQMVVLAASFVVLAVIVDGAWALAAARARRLLVRHSRLRNRLSGGCLFGAALGLAATRTT